MLALPESRRVLQVPQMPERHSKSMATPQASAISRMGAPGGAGMDLPEREKTTSGAEPSGSPSAIIAATDSAPAGPSVAAVSSVGPEAGALVKASSLMRESGTPRERSISV